MQNINPKIQDKINKIIYLQDEIKKWEEKDEFEIENLMKNFEKMKNQFFIQNISLMRNLQISFWL